MELGLYTLMHFLVDLTCIYRMASWVQYRAADAYDWLILALLYNFLAFALPGFLGLVADMADQNHLLSAIGCIMVGISVFISAPLWLLIGFAGIGNGLFHIGIGRQVLEQSDGRYAPSGIFISSGAMGVFLGTTLGGTHYHPWDYVMAAVLFTFAVLLVFMNRKVKIQNKRSDSKTCVSISADDSNREKRTDTGKVHFITIPVLMLLLVVVLRSYYGFAVSYDWKNTWTRGLIFAFCIVGGKAVGGIAADKIGVRLTTILSLGGAALTVLFSADSMLLGCISILLFNMTMPLTLNLLAAYWKNYPGFAFGMLMMALFLGSVPDAVITGMHTTMMQLCAICLISLVMLLIGIGKEGTKHAG